MLMRAFAGGTILVLALAAAGHAQLPPPEQSLPAGFHVSNTVSNGIQVGYQATKSQTLPKCFDTLPQDIHLGWVWQSMPGARQVIEMMARAPEDTLTRMGMTVTEPAGKVMLRGGSLAWKKTTVPCMGIGQSPPLVTYEGKWIGPWHDGMLAVSVENALGTPTEIRPWVEQVLTSILGPGAGAGAGAGTAGSTAPGKSRTRSPARGTPR